MLEKCSTAVHQPIVDQDTFEATQVRLAEQAPARRIKGHQASSHLLTGLLFDETGDRLSPTHAVKQGRRYRYYISRRLAEVRRQGRNGWRLPAQDIETLVFREMAGF